MRPRLADPFPSCLAIPLLILQHDMKKEEVMAIVSIQEAQASLQDLIHNMAPGDEIVITENDQAVAKLVSEAPKLKPGLRPPPGLGKGCITIISDDDEHLNDFAEYMP